MTENVWERLLDNLEFLHEQMPMSVTREQLASALAEAAETEGLALVSRTG